MSNRLRILFHCDLDGPRAYVGRRALERMRHLGATAEPPTPTRVLTHKEWVRRGHPEFVEKRLSWPGLGEAEILYVLKASPASPFSKNASPASPDAPSTPAAQVDFGLSVQSAKMLWKRLPRAIRDISQLMVMREGRSNCWRQSATNPRRHGWIFATKPPKAAKSPQTASTSGNKAPDALTPGALWWTTSGPLDLVETPPAYAPVPTSLAAAANVLTEAAAAIEAFPTEAPQVAKNPGQVGHSFAYQSPKAYSKPKKKVRAKLSPISDGDSDGQEKPSKPKLKLGIWS